MSYDFEDMLALAEEFPGYGTSMHYPYCNLRNCSGCIPDYSGGLAEPQPKLDLSIFKKD